MLISWSSIIQWGAFIFQRGHKITLNDIAKSEFRANYIKRFSKMVIAWVYSCPSSRFTVTGFTVTVCIYKQFYCFRWSFIVIATILWHSQVGLPKNIFSRLLYLILASKTTLLTIWKCLFKHSKKKSFLWVRVRNHRKCVHMHGIIRAIQ